MLDLHYLVSAWTGSIRDEHQLIGDVFTCLLGIQVMPVEHLPVELDSRVQLAIASQESNRAKDVWSTIGGTLKPSFELVVTTAVDGMPFAGLATPVQRIEAMVAPKPASVPISESRG
jgi:hypothetical protein